MTPLQQAEQALAGLIAAAECIRHWSDDGRDGEGMIVSGEKVRALWAETDRAKLSLAAIRAAQNQPDAGAVIDACEVALEEIRDSLAYPDETIWIGEEKYIVSIGYPDDDETRFNAAKLHDAISSIRAYRESRKAGLWKLIRDIDTDHFKVGDWLGWFNGSGWQQRQIKNATAIDLFIEAGYTHYYRPDPPPPPPAPEGGGE